MCVISPLSINQPLGRIKRPLKVGINNRRCIYFLCINTVHQRQKVTALRQPSTKCSVGRAFIENLPNINEIKPCGDLPYTRLGLALFSSWTMSTTISKKDVSLVYPEYNTHTQIPKCVLYFQNFISRCTLWIKYLNRTVVKCSNCRCCNLGHSPVKT